RQSSRVRPPSECSPLLKTTTLCYKATRDEAGSAARKGAAVKAVLHTHYGSPDLLEFREIEKPAPRDNEILISIHTTTVSTGDCNVRNFTFVTKAMLPFAKLAFGIGKPW